MQEYLSGFDPASVQGIVIMTLSFVVGYGIGTFIVKPLMNYLERRKN